MEVCNGMLDTRKVGKGLGFHIVLAKGQKKKAKPTDDMIRVSGGY
jgi:hypothetical protein